MAEQEQKQAENEELEAVASEEGVDEGGDRSDALRQYQENAAEQQDDQERQQEPSLTMQKVTDEVAQRSEAHRGPFRITRSSTISAST